MKHIAILVPVCSRKQNYTTLSSTPFMKILYPSFLKAINKTKEVTKKIIKVKRL